MNHSLNTATARAKTGIFWFSNDLRVADNAALSRAAEACERLLCVYIVEPRWFTPNRYGLRSMGKYRWRFLAESLQDLKSALEEYGQSLHIFYEPPLEALAKLIAEYDPGTLIRSQNAGFYEKKQWQLLKQRYRLMNFEEVATHTLFKSQTLPFNLEDPPCTFSKFRKIVEPIKSANIARPINTLPPPPKISKLKAPKLPPINNEQKDNDFTGGAREANKHLHEYFSSNAPSSYKQTRNQLEGWEYSTKFSPWLANGSLSANQVLKAVEEYERKVEANESTYWIKFELLWREYFQWYAHLHGAKLYKIGGVNNKKSLKTFYAERFSRWCEGNTPYPIVNACMKQLNETGYMSNRGRQIVASCLINELDMDWRYGAAYFEQQLLDYDVASNWGNWQYIAGVGADPRGGRHFNIQKQAAIYDPNGGFVEHWNGDVGEVLMDSVDAADWPITR